MASVEDSRYYVIHCINTTVKFREFIENEDNLPDVKKTLQRLPARHRKLAKKFKFIFQPGNALRGDNKHVGVIDDSKMTITIAAPWLFPREFTLLHEIGHLIWKKCVDEKMREKWGKVLKATKGKKEDTEEELFCHAYAAAYSSYPPEAYRHNSWVRFITAIK